MELRDFLISQLSFKAIQTCRTQQAFYQLKHVLKEESVQVNSIHPNTRIEQLLPRKNKLQFLKKIKANMGIRLNLPNYPRPRTLLFFTILTLWMSYFFSWKFSLLGGLFVSFLYYWTIVLFLKKYSKQTVRTFIEKIVFSNYFTVSELEKGVNSLEIKQMLLFWFSHHSGINPNRLADAHFGN